MYDHKPDLNKPTPIELAARIVLGNPKHSDCAWAAAMLRDFHATLAAANAENERLRAENERLVNRITELNSELTQTELAVEQLQTLIDAI